MDDTPISSIAELASRVESDSRDWRFRWFRGERKDYKRTSLLPALYRTKRSDGKPHNENQLLQRFRLKSLSLASGPLPDRDATDQWLFLARHVGLLTRLLDWTESLLVALYFALEEVGDANAPGNTDAVVWMLNPMELNKLSYGDGLGEGFPINWMHVGNIRGAWELDRVGTKFPVAVLPSYVHPRLGAQKACFTVHGWAKQSLKEQVGPDILKRDLLSPEKRGELRNQLRLLGVDHTTVYPDLEHLAQELGEQF
jgi:hypothetical protein